MHAIHVSFQLIYGSLFPGQEFSAPIVLFLINSNGVIRIMTFKLLWKICWIDNSFCTLGKKLNFCLKIFFLFENLKHLFKFFKRISNFFSWVYNEISIQHIFHNNLKVIILITLLLLYYLETEFWDLSIPFHDPLVK